MVDSQARLPGYREFLPVRETAWTQIYYAVEEGTGRRVVIKASPDTSLFGQVALSDLAPVLWGEEAVGCLRKHEYDVLRCVDSRNSPAGLDLVVHEDRPFLVMERLAGEPAASFAIAPENRFEEIVDIGVQAAKALDRAHCRDIVHRDITPSNLFVERDASGLTVSIIDWELADRAGIRPWGAVGTSAYKAPEQFALSLWPEYRVDARADLYALGATLFHLAAGAPPCAFTSYRKAANLLVRHCSLGEVCPDAPEVLVAVVDRLLQRDPKHRIPTAADVARLLSTSSAPSPAPASFPRCDSGAANEAATAGDLITAVSLLDPDEIRDPLAGLAWTRVWLACGANRRAEESAVTALALGAPPDEALSLAARAVRAEGRFGLALDLARQGRNAPGGEEQLGACLVEVGQTDEAEVIFRRLSARDQARARQHAREQLDLLLRCSRRGRLPALLEAILVRAVWLAGQGDSERHRPVLFRLAHEAAAAIEGHALRDRVQIAHAVALFGLGTDEAARAVVASLPQSAFSVAQSLVPLEVEQLLQGRTAYAMGMLEMGLGVLARSFVACDDEQPIDRLRLALALGDNVAAADAMDAACTAGIEAPLDLRALAALRDGRAADAVALAVRATDHEPEKYGGWWVLADAQLGIDAQEAARAAKRSYEVCACRATGRRLATAAVAAEAWADALEPAVLFGDPGANWISVLDAIVANVSRVPSALQEPLRALVMRADPCDFCVVTICERMASVLGGGRSWIETWCEVLAAKGATPEVALRVAAVAPDEPVVGRLLHAVGALGAVAAGSGASWRVARVLAEMGSRPEAAWELVKTDLKDQQSETMRDLCLEVAAAAEEWEALRDLARDTHPVFAARAARKLGDYEEAFGVCRAIESPAVAEIETLKVLLASGDYEQVIEQGGNLVARTGAGVEVLFFMGAALLLLGSRQRNAETIAATLLHLAPNDPRSWFLATWYHGVSRSLRAEETALGLVGTQGAIAPALCVYAYVLRDLQRTSEARALSLECAACTRSERVLLDLLRSSLDAPRRSVETPWPVLLSHYYEPRVAVVGTGDRGFGGGGNQSGKS